MCGGSWQGGGLTQSRRFSDLEKNRSRFHIADLEPGELDFVDIILWAT